MHKTGGSNKYLYDVLPLISKAAGIPVFATDEKDLQLIIDKQLNTGMDGITCIRIVDIITKAKDGKIVLPRKIAKALWLVAGKKKDMIDCTGDLSMAARQVGSKKSYMERVRLFDGRH